MDKKVEDIFNKYGRKIDQEIKYDLEKFSSAVKIDKH